MRIDEETAQQFLDAVNDWLSNGDRHIQAISEEEAGNMSRREMDDFLFDLFEATLKLREPRT